MLAVNPPAGSFPDGEAPFPLAGLSVLFEKIVFDTVLVTQPLQALVCIPCHQGTRERLSRQREASCG
jgi:hypothetical protein